MSRRTPITTTPRSTSYDVVIVGGAIIGSSVAWWLSREPGFDGTVLVVEKDPLYQQCSTAHTNSCMRQQFSERLNIQIPDIGRLKHIIQEPDRNSWIQQSVP